MNIKLRVDRIVIDFYFHLEHTNESEEKIQVDFNAID